jgi:hypothetical protein
MQIENGKNLFWYFRNVYFCGGLFSAYSKFEVRDIWVGVFWDITRDPDGGQTLAIYICILPMLPFIIKYYPLDRTGKNG